MSSAANAGAAVVVWVQDDGDALLTTVLSVRTALPDAPVYIGGRSDRTGLIERLRRLDPTGHVSEVSGTLADAVAGASESFTRHVLVISAPVVLPKGVLDLALPALDDDLRLASVSFLSNAAGALSVPHRNSPVFHQVGVHDEVSITRILRASAPAPTMVPIGAPTGAVVLLSRSALGAVGGIDPDAMGSAEFLVADVALFAARRGFLNVLDEGTYVTRAFDLAHYRSNPIDDPGDLEWGHLAHRHPNWIDRYQRDRTSEHAALGASITTASAKIRGLRIIIDGRNLGPKEMGTQVQILSMVRELAARDDVASVQLGIPGEIPGYATPFLVSEKVRTFASPSGDLLEAEPADVIHRPSQPSDALPFDAWRARASRVVVSLLDLIAYQVGSYHHDGASWERYREHLVAGAVGADAVISISHETVRQIEAERLPLDPNRVFVVPLGTDHLTGHEDEVFPAELGARGFLSDEYLLVLGTNYGHKNRDLAIRAWRLLRNIYPNLALVLAGAFVPAGSSRVAEAVASHGLDGDGLFVLPDVSSAERNWLMRHARAVLYPTSAEGFGFVPFEAAVFGSPAVGVRFAPLDEFNDPPVWATGWTEDELATATGRLLESPAVAAEQVRRTLQSAARLQWVDCAEELVRVYRTALSLPARRSYRG